MASPHLEAELATMAFASRTFGGMRTSDLHAWDWKHEALWQAGIVRPLEGFADARDAWQAAQRELERAVPNKATRAELDALGEAAVAAEQRARTLCLIQAGSEDFKPPGLSQLPPGLCDRPRVDAGCRPTLSCDA